MTEGNPPLPSLCDSGMPLNGATLPSDRWHSTPTTCSLDPGRTAVPEVESVRTPSPSARPVILPAAERLLLDILDTVREPLLVLDDEFRVTHANRAFFHTFKVEPEDTIGTVLFALGDGQWDIVPLREMLRDKLPLESQLDDFDVDHEFPGIGRKIMLLNARLVSQGPDEPRIILLAIATLLITAIFHGYRLLVGRPRGSATPGSAAPTADGTVPLATTTTTTTSQA